MAMQNDAKEGLDATEVIKHVMLGSIHAKISLRLKYPSRLKEVIYAGAQGLYPYIVANSQREVCTCTAVALVVGCVAAKTTYTQRTTSVSTPPPQVAISVPSRAPLARRAARETSSAP